MGKEELVICFQDTFEQSNNERLKQRTTRAAKSNRVYKEGFVSKVKHRNESASIDVYSETTFDVAKSYCSLGKVAVLNFANPENPGGGVQLGAMAQEECLCRSSNLYACISNPNIFDEYYGYHRGIRSHFYTDRLIYTKNVTVFKDDSLVPQMMLETDWFDVDVITCAAPYLAKRKYTNGAALFNLFKSRVKNIFEAARDNNVDYLILGAFGCGAFKNPPLIVAEAFRRTIDEQNYLKDFKQIVFAIKPTGEYCPNLSTFLSKFDIYAPDAGERTALLDEPLEWRLHRSPALPTESRFSDNRKFSSWQLENKYFGKQFSVLGDSISTLDGFNPKGYKVFYSGDNCAKSGVVKATDTWWDKVIGFFGGELLVNNSWSGSRVTRLKDKEQLFPSGCSDERTAALHINDVKPDVILVYLGTNDWANGIPTLEYWENSGDYENWLGTMLLPNEECFDVAYEQMLTKLRANYPNAEVWCCTLCETYISKRPDFKFPHKYAGTHIEEYNEIIRDIARKNGCRLIDLYSYRKAYDSIDGSHPTDVGMNTIATMVIREMSDQKAGRFLDCENAEHDYVVNEQYTGGTKYVCSKCAKVMHTTTLLPPQEVTMDAKIDLSRYVWGDRHVNRISKISLSWGDLPTYHIDVENDTVRLYRRINGSRDGWMSFPDGYFEEKKKSVDGEERKKLFRFLETIDFTKWITEETTINNIENMACGFCVSESFSCTFDDDTTFYCAVPPKVQFKELVEHFRNFFPEENLEPFHPDIIPIDEEKPVLGCNNIIEDSEYVMLDPNITTILYSDTLRFTVASTGETKEFNKTVVNVGRDPSNDYHLAGKTYIARRQATFFYERQMWFLRDNNSTNGTYINGKRLEPGKKYQLATNDEISFAKQETIIFDKHMRPEQSKGDPEAKALVFLEAGMATFAKSQYKDDAALKLIVAALMDAPLYFPVEIGLSAMLGSVDPTKLKAGDTIQPQKDVCMRILTLCPEAGVETVPMFTSNEEANKGPVASMIRFYPQDYLPKLIEMDKPVIINPFSESRFLLSKQIITEILWPAVQRKIADNMSKQENDTVKPPVHDNLVGSKIGERYTVLKLLGQGGFFKTYLVIDEKCNKSWAMKVCEKNHRSYSPTLREVILQEPHMMMKLDHPAVPKVVDIIEDENHICIIREYIEGQTLDAVLQENGPIKQDTALTWAQQLCDVLGYLHKQNPPYIYRDMKPANVILQPCGNVKLVDFGAVTEYDALSDQYACILGTKGYAAPEQYSGKSDPRSDIYGLGITLHHLLTGVDPNMPPYETKPIRAVNPNLSRDLEAIILRCTQLNPEDRFQNCNELMTALQGGAIYPPKKKSFLEKIFGGKSAKPKLNSKVVKIFEGMNKEYREKVFYGSVISADIILTAMTCNVFGTVNDANIDLCFQIYLQTWIRSHGGLDPTFSTPSYIQQALCERFSSVDSALVSKCVTHALCEIYEREPELKKRASAIEAVQNNVRTNAQKNIAIENLYLEDSEYGLVPGKPVFVNGFGRDKEYLSHLYTDADEKLSFERVGSSEVSGIAGPVDLYRLILPNGEDYLRIFICNYGSSYKKATPKGVKYID